MLCIDPMVQTYRSIEGTQYHEINPAISREAWLREVADEFFTRNGIINKPDIFVFSDQNKPSHALHPENVKQSLIKKDMPYGYIGIKDATLEELYAKRHEGSKYAMEWLLGHEYHHTVHNNHTWKNSEKLDFITGIGGAIAGAVAGAMTALNIPKKFSIPPKIATAMGAMFGFLAGNFLGERRSSRFDEARAELSGIKMLVHGRDEEERKLALEKSREFKPYPDDIIHKNSLINLIAKHPTLEHSKTQDSLIAQHISDPPEKLETVFQTVDQNLINIARNPLQFAIHYG